MDFSFSEEQQQLQDAIAPLPRKATTASSAASGIVASPEGWSREVWARPGRPGRARRCTCPRTTAASATAPIDTMLAMQAARPRPAVSSRYLASAVIATALVRDFGTRRAAGRAAAGAWPRASASCVLGARRSRLRAATLRWVETRATQSGDGCVLRRPQGGGRCTRAAADELLVSARTRRRARRRARRERSSSCRASAAGVALQGLRARSTASRAAEVILRDVQRARRARCLGAAGAGAARDRARARPRPRRALRRGRGRDGSHRRRHHRVPQDAPAVRPAHRPLPGAAAPHGRHAAAPGAGALDGVSRGHELHARRRHAAPQTLLGGQGA